MGEEKKAKSKTVTFTNFGTLLFMSTQIQEKENNQNEYHYLFHLFLNLHGYTLERKNISLLLYHYL